ncbi:hypothetical protein MATR_04310 [Marivirga tractuosa]|uniref:Uncharacterized protein n=1 Tax=Marivirga tractuosa (strain ATCC 23168 / DSM 4126 / NBRC 15989 / NCIMB 1408 / VKM B-1430 / H-43) TaxID=643867 RepID=E4TTA5_MARTH|nr:hypothetical protein [Marivirga tractuosa]ADR21935.1 hypothetical protein Ftrac_1950 [Marivirga tractuosa DSM 4126]BDD13606.1 hypothetical protein MATR_04310 [Marivirga tractuosa]
MKFLTDRYIRSLFLIGLGIYFIVEHEIRERPQSTEDLIDLHGTITDYSFKDNTGWRGNGRQYYIYLDGYPTKFQVKADYLRFFNKQQFEYNFKRDSRVKLSIPRYQESLVGTDENVFLTSISVNGFEFLSKDETISREITMATSNSDYILGGVSIVIGILIFLFYDKIKKSY